MMNTIVRTIREFGNSQRLKVFGAVKVQCPVWVLHLKMKTVDNDPFFPIDKAILSYFDMHAKVNLPYFANLIGFNQDFIISREKELRELAMVRIDENGEYVITDGGRQKYLSGNGERPEVTVYGDLVLDGLSLRLLDREFYASKAPYSDRRSSMIVPAILKGTEDPAIIKAIQKIEKMTASEKESYLLERTSHGYEVEDYDLKSIDNVYVVLSHDPENKTCRRDVFFRNRFIPKVDSLADVIDRYYLYLNNTECHSSEGYVPKDGNPYTCFSLAEIKSLIKDRYSLSDTMDGDFQYDPSPNPVEGFPLTIKISESMLQRTENPSRLMSDALAEYFDLEVKGGSNNGRKGGFFIVKVINSMPEKINRYKALNDYVKKNGHVDMGFIETYYSQGKGWRQEFIDLGLLEELEVLDIQQFIKYDLDKEDDYV